MLKTSSTRSLSQGNDSLADDRSADVKALALNATAVRNSDSIGWLDGGWGFASVTEEAAPATESVRPNPSLATAPVEQTQQTPPITIPSKLTA
jgi:hypothetical protein